MKKKVTDELSEFDQPMRLIDDPAFEHASNEDVERDPLPDFNHPQIPVPDDAPAPKGRNMTAQGNALG